MAQALSTKSLKKTTSSGEGGSARREQVPQSLRNSGPSILNLQRACGNQAVSEFLLRAIGDRHESGNTNVQPEVPDANGSPLEPATREFMESRFDHDFSQVRVHSDAQAARSARSLNAKAYTVGQDIVFKHGVYAPQSNQGRELIAHELAHVIQQERSGSQPVLDSNAPHEHSADAAAREVVGGTGPVDVGGATGIGIARSVDDWLNGTLDISTLSFTQLLDEIDEIDQWLGDQISTSPEFIRLTEIVEKLRAEAARQRKTATAPAKRPKKKVDKRRGKGRKETEEQPVEELRKPRVLTERASFQYDDPAEMRQEVDLIVAWLQRKNVPRAEREILQTELQNLAPQLQDSRIQNFAERRARKIERALTPKVSGTAREQLIEAVQLIDSIKPLADQPGFSYLMFGDQMIVLQDSEAQMIREGIIGMMDKAAKKISDMNDETFDRYKVQEDINYKEHPGVGFVVSLFVGDEPVDILQKMLVYWQRSDAYFHRFQNVRKQGALIQMAEALANAEEDAIKARSIVDNWAADTLETAGNIVVGLTITRDLSFAITTSYFGGAGIASLTRSGVGLVKAGLTVSAVGAGGGAVARGGTNIIGQKISGGPIDWNEALQETGRGARAGALDAPIGAVSRGVQGVAKIKEGVSVTRRVAAAGVTSGIGGAMHEIGQGRAPTVKGTLVNVATGGVSEKLKLSAFNRIANPRVRSAVEVGTEAAIGGLGSKATGGSFTEGAVSSLVVGAATRGAKAPSTPTPSRRPPPQAPKGPPAKRTLRGAASSVGRTGYKSHKESQPVVEHRKGGPAREPLEPTGEQAQAVSQSRKVERAASESPATLEERDRAFAVTEQEIQPGVVRRRRTFSSHTVIPERTVKNVPHEKVVEHIESMQKAGVTLKVPPKHLLSHAEVQQVITNPNTPIGVNRPMCASCIRFFQAEAKFRGQAQVVSDPGATRVFEPDGTMTEYWNDGSAIEFSADGKSVRVEPAK